MSDAVYRQTEFETRARAALGADSAWAVTRAFGVSNSARIVPGGIQVAVANLASVSPTTQGWLILSALYFPTGAEVYFALAVCAGIRALRERLSAMSAAAAGDRDQLSPSDDLTYAARNNNVAVYLGDDALMGIRNKGFWTGIPPDLAAFEPRVPVEAAYLWAWAPDAVRIHDGATELVGHIERVLGDARVRIDGLSTVAPPDWTVPGLLELRSRFNALGGNDPDGVIERLHVALFAQGSGVAILSGVPRETAQEMLSLYSRVLTQQASASVVSLAAGLAGRIEPSSAELTLAYVDLDEEPAQLSHLLALGALRAAGRGDAPRAFQVQDSLVAPGLLVVGSLASLEVDGVDTRTVPIVD